MLGELLNEVYDVWEGNTQETEFSRRKAVELIENGTGELNRAYVYLIDECAAYRQYIEDDKVVDFSYDSLDAIVSAAIPVSQTKKYLQQCIENKEKLDKPTTRMLESVWQCYFKPEKSE